MDADMPEPADVMVCMFMLVPLSTHGCTLASSCCTQHVAIHVHTADEGALRPVPDTLPTHQMGHKSLLFWLQLDLGPLRAQLEGACAAATGAKISPSLDELHRLAGRIPDEQAAAAAARLVASVAGVP